MIYYTKWYNLATQQDEPVSVHQWRAMLANINFLKSAWETNFLTIGGLEYVPPLYLHRTTSDIPLESSAFYSINFYVAAAGTYYLEIFVDESKIISAPLTSSAGWNTITGTTDLLTSVNAGLHEIKIDIPNATKASVLTVYIVPKSTKISTPSIGEIADKDLPNYIISWLNQRGREFYLGTSILENTTITTDTYANDMHLPVGIDSAAGITNSEYFVKSFLTTKKDQDLSGFTKVDDVGVKISSVSSGNVAETTATGRQYNGPAWGVGITPPILTSGQNVVDYLTLQTRNTQSTTTPYDYLHTLTLTLYNNWSDRSDLVTTLNQKEISESSLNSLIQTINNHLTKLGGPRTIRTYPGGATVAPSGWLFNNWHIPHFWHYFNDDTKLDIQVQFIAKGTVAGDQVQLTIGSASEGTLYYPIVTLTDTIALYSVKQTINVRNHSYLFDLGRVYFQNISTNNITIYGYMAMITGIY